MQEEKNAKRDLQVFITLTILEPDILYMRRAAGSK